MSEFKDDQLDEVIGAVKFIAYCLVLCASLVALSIAESEGVQFFLGAISVVVFLSTSFTSDKSSKKAMKALSPRKTQSD